MDWAIPLALVFAYAVFCTDRVVRQWLAVWSAKAAVETKRQSSQVDFDLALRDLNEKYERELDKLKGRKMVKLLDGREVPLDNLEPIPGMDGVD